MEIFNRISTVRVCAASLRPVKSDAEAWKNQLMNVEHENVERKIHAALWPFILIDYNLASVFANGFPSHPSVRLLSLRTLMQNGFNSRLV
jgi:hypothetical protein